MSGWAATSRKIGVNSREHSSIWAPRFIFVAALVLAFMPAVWWVTESYFSIDLLTILGQPLDNSHCSLRPGRLGLCDATQSRIASTAAGSSSLLGVALNFEFIGVVVLALALAMPVLWSARDFNSNERISIIGLIGLSSISGLVALTQTSLSILAVPLALSFAVSARKGRYLLAAMSLLGLMVVDLRLSVLGIVLLTMARLRLLGIASSIVCILALTYVDTWTFTDSLQQQLLWVPIVAIAAFALAIAFVYSRNHYLVRTRCMSTSVFATCVLVAVLIDPRYMILGAVLMALLLKPIRNSVVNDPPDADYSNSRATGHFNKASSALTWWLFISSCSLMWLPPVRIWYGVSLPRLSAVVLLIAASAIAAGVITAKSSNHLSPSPSAFRRFSS